MAQALLQELAVAASAGLSVLGDKGLVGANRIPFLVGGTYQGPREDLLAYWGVTSVEELEARELADRKRADRFDLVATHYENSLFLGNNFGELFPINLN